jgi:hypothetical protein
MQFATRHELPWVLRRQRAMDSAGLAVQECDGSAQVQRASRRAVGENVAEGWIYAVEGQINNASHVHVSVTVNEY